MGFEKLKEQYCSALGIKEEDADNLKRFKDIPFKEYGSIEEYQARINTNVLFDVCRTFCGTHIYYYKNSEAKEEPSFSTKLLIQHISTKKGYFSVFYKCRRKCIFLDGEKVEKTVLKVPKYIWLQDNTKYIPKAEEILLINNYWINVSFFG
ncbi:MAG: hypothetical protein RSE00_04955 [Clostridia bacterium]